jgi:glycosyltransferase involved in cell wall biosynthesis
VTFYLVGPYYPFRGGIAQYLAILGKKLEERGHRVKVLSFRKQFPRFLFPGQTQLETSRDYIRLESEALFIPWNPLSWWRTFQAARRGRPEALIFKYWMPFFAPGYAAVCYLTRKFTAIRTIYVLDNVIPHERRPGDRFLTRLALRWVDGFIVQSKTVKVDLLAWFPAAGRMQIAEVAHPVYDCYPGAELSPTAARAKLSLNPSGKIILFFGLVRHYKGLDTLLQAMPAIHAALGSEVHLIVAGEFYQPEAEYRQTIADLHLEEIVTLHNHYIPNEDVALYFRAADVLALPYRSATQSGVIQVAYHFGLPVISTRVGGLPEVVDEGHTGFLVEPENPARLADAIIRFFRFENYATMRGAARAAGERFSWGPMVESIERLSHEN